MDGARVMDVETLKRLIDEAEHGKPELPAEIVNFHGFSAPKVRRLLNALCSQPGANYLEIGVHEGSTFIPALYGNKAQATAIDNWEMFHSRPIFDRNRAKHLPGRKVNIIQADCFTLTAKQLPSGVTVYFYDGSHTRDAQYHGVKDFLHVMADRCVLLVDDCNYVEPREETVRALKDAGCNVLYDVLLPGAYDGDQVGWWNGLYVALIVRE